MSETQQAWIITLLIVLLMALLASVYTIHTLENKLFECRAEKAKCENLNNLWCDPEGEPAHHTALKVEGRRIEVGTLSGVEDVFCRLVRDSDGYVFVCPKGVSFE